MAFKVKEKKNLFLELVSLARCEKNSSSGDEESLGCARNSASSGDGKS